MIALGIQHGSPRDQQNGIDHFLVAVMRKVADLRGSNYDSGEEGWINPIFIVPGSIFPPPDFVGLKLGHYSKKRRGLVVMIAVPPEIRDADDGLRFVEGALREAVVLAAERFKKKGDPFSFIKANRLIDDVMKSVA
jgi:hypothetical protein